MGKDQKKIMEASPPPPPKGSTPPSLAPSSSAPVPVQAPVTSATPKVKKTYKKKAKVGTTSEATRRKQGELIPGDIPGLLRSEREEVVVGTLNELLILTFVSSPADSIPKISSVQSRDSSNITPVRSTPPPTHAAARRAISHVIRRLTFSSSS